MVLQVVVEVVESEGQPEVPFPAGSRERKAQLSVHHLLVRERVQTQESRKARRQILLEAHPEVLLPQLKVEAPVVAVVAYEQPSASQGLVDPKFGVGEELPGVDAAVAQAEAIGGYSSTLPFEVVPEIELIANQGVQVEEVVPVTFLIGEALILPGHRDDPGEYLPDAQAEKEPTHESPPVRSSPRGRGPRRNPGSDRWAIRRSASGIGVWEGEVGWARVEQGCGEWIL
jgi:hypothetical protein